MQLVPVSYGPRDLVPVTVETTRARATAPVLAVRAAGDQGRTARDHAPWVEVLSMVRDEAHGHGPFVAQRIAQEDMTDDSRLRHQQGAAAYVKARDSRVQLLLSDKIVDLRV